LISGAGLHGDSDVPIATGEPCRGLSLVGLESVDIDP
jgi:hypothetical protein